jgi:tRNA uridine 5-carboxymethylaminomethyl modification enzyme
MLLKETKPESVGQARRIEGMTPHGCLRLLAYVQSGRKKEAQAAFSRVIESRKQEFASIRSTRPSSPH